MNQKVARHPLRLVQRSIMDLYTTSFPIRVRYVIFRAVLIEEVPKPTASFQDGKLELVQAASVSIHGNHGQHIENVHLEKYTSEDHFWNDLYPNRYRRILDKAKDFLDSTGGPGDDVMIFIRYACR